MKIVDDRRPEQAKNEVLIVAKDNFLSGWGQSKGGNSIAAWSCEPANAQAVKKWVESRTDMSNVRIENGDYVPKNAAHFHIYNADMKIINNQLNNKNTLNPAALEKAKMNVENENAKFSKDINSMTKSGMELD
jgi:hypothetical protein